MKNIFFMTAIILLIVFLFLNVGKWIDCTTDPIKSDIVICLGGGTIDRVKKSIKLIEEDYVSSNKLLLIGESWYNQPYLKKNYSDISVTIDESSKNTKDEILFIKRYMKKYNYKSALIVTDPPHSRRVKLLTSILLEEDNSRIYYIISSDVKWWNARYYYLDEHARSFVFYESMKILYHRIFDSKLFKGRSIL